MILPLHGVHKSVFDRIERVESAYVTAGDVDAADWAIYQPAALLNGRWLPLTHTLFQGPIAETLDYRG